MKEKYINKFRSYFYGIVFLLILALGFNSCKPAVCSLLSQNHNNDYALEKSQNNDNAFWPCDMVPHIIIEGDEEYKPGKIEDKEIVQFKRELSSIN